MGLGGRRRRAALHHRLSRLRVHGPLRAREIPKLRAAGIEARIILFARPDREGLAQSTAAERATIAELWLTRDWTLYQRWTATPVRNWTAAGIPAADGNLARGAVVEAGRSFVARLTADLRRRVCRRAIRSSSGATARAS